MREKVKNLVLTMMPAVLLAVWAGYLLWQISAGMPVKIKLRGYDPRDLLAGQYISYVLDWDATDCAQFAQGICPKDEFGSYGKNRGRFYVPEHLAKLLEQDIQNSNNVAEMVFSYRPWPAAAGFEPAGQRQNVEWARELFLKQIYRCL